MDDCGLLEEPPIFFFSFRVVIICKELDFVMGRLVCVVLCSKIGAIALTVGGMVVLLVHAI